MSMRYHGRRDQHHAPRSGGIEPVPTCPGSTTTRWRRGARYVETVFDLNAALEADLAPHGLTLGDYQVLVYLSEADDRVDAHVRPRRTPAALPERAHPPARRAGARPGWSSAGRRSSDRRVMLAVLDRPAAARTSSEVAPTTSRSVRRHVIDRLDRADIAAMARIFGAIRDGLRADRPAPTPDDRAPRGLRAATSPTSASRTTPTTSSSIAADTAGRRPPACSPAAASPGRASRSAAAPRRRPGPGRRRRLEERQRRQRAGRAAPTPTSSSPPSPTGSGARRRRARRLDRRDRPALPDGADPAPGSRRCPSPLPRTDADGRGGAGS